MIPNLEFTPFLSAGTPPAAYDLPTAFSPMKITSFLIICATGCSALPVLAQTTNVPAAAGAPAAVAADDAVVLSPFVVDTTKDVGWSGTDTLMANRTRQALKDVPFSIDAITADFIQDLDLGTADDVARFAAGVSATFQMENKNDENGFSFRGIAASGGTAATNLARNYFRSSTPSDSYNVERIDFGKGSNSLVFGDTDPGGMGAVATKRAAFRNFGRAFLQYGSEGAYRAELDVNRQLGKQVALRLNLVQREQKTFQDFSEYALKAGHLALTWRPFKHTEVRVEGEQGRFANTRGFTGIQVREASARSLSFSPGAWYFTSDGNAFNAATLPAPDRTNANGPTGAALSVLEGQSVDVLRVNAAGAVIGTQRINGLPMAANLRGKFDLFARPFNTYSLFVDQQVGKLGLEFGYNFQNQNADRNDGNLNSTVSVDVNGRPYTDADSVDRKFIGDEIHAFRVLASFPWQPFKWMRQQLTASVDYRDWNHDQLRVRLSNYAGFDNRTQPSVTAADQIRFRAYLDDPLFYSSAFYDKFLIQNLPQTATFRPDWLSYDNSDTFAETSWAAAISATGSYFGGRVQTVLGIRHDDNIRYLYNNAVGNLRRDAAGGLLPAPRYRDAAPNDYLVVPLLDYGHNSGSAGVTVALSRNINLYSAWSTSFKAQDAITFDNQILGPITGESKEIGLKGELFNRQATVSMGVFEIARQNAAFSWTPQSTGGAVLDSLFNPNHLAPGDPAYVTYQRSPPNRVASTESSRGFDATILFRPFTGLQVRLTVAKIDLGLSPDFSTFRTLLADARARGNEDPSQINDAQAVLDNNDVLGKPLGSRGAPWSGSWAVDYAFARDTAPVWHGVRIGCNGIWRTDYLLALRNNVEYWGGGTHIVGAYLMRDQKIWGQDVRVRFGAKGLFDLANGDDPRHTGIVAKLDGSVAYVTSYIMPVQYDASLTVRF